MHNILERQLTGEEEGTGRTKIFLHRCGMVKYKTAKPSQRGAPHRGGYYCGIYRYLRSNIKYGERLHVNNCLSFPAGHEIGRGGVEDGYRGWRRVAVDLRYLMTTFCVSSSLRPGPGNVAIPLQGYSANTSHSRRSPEQGLAELKLGSGTNARWGVTCISTIHHGKRAGNRQTWRVLCRRADS